MEHTHIWNAPFVDLLLLAYLTATPGDTWRYELVSHA